MRDLTLIIDALILFIKENWHLIFCFLCFTLAATIAIGALVIGDFQVKREKQRISDYLRRSSSTNIVISMVWFDMDKTTRTYNVKYTNSRGKHCQTSCKIRTGIFSSGEIYWTNHP
ncbi:hypothetical protein JOY44_29935 (plasmid) [Phormidium sp. CLA17]|uniref:hypothetical protein n=1 Tax=Leptolyngbya sp. Cla-17 TaxID=2803751 RepID=UPI001492D83C|nr:hypothetical protein [Leptolyngbya sp. Cla-17]MBM0745545.1 hypothetical protein [Leptolyngbya sp. Cla-17]MBM0745643.1 hypothetical protein [Leptolyngbya sp. Cla-17]